MRRRRLALGLVPLVPVLSLVGACSTAPARVGLVMRAPQGLLDAATKVELAVFPAEQARCDANGHVDAIPSGDDTQRFTLEQSGCPAGVTWCKDIELDEDGSDQMFAVIASNAGGTLAEGCAVATIDQDPLEVSIKVQRYNPPPCCNDGVLQAGEQCDFGVAAPTTCGGDPGGQCLGITADPVCECDCRAKEILLSIDDTALPFIANGPAGSKSQLAMTFAPGNTKIAGALRAVFRSQGDDATGNVDVNIRYLSKDLYPIEDPFPLSQQLRMPLRCGDVQGGGIAQAQESPSIAQVDADLTGVVYASDQSIPNIFDVWLVIHAADGCKEECAMNDAACLAKDTPVKLNLPTQQPGATDPDIAGGPPGTALVVWSSKGGVHGRLWNSSGQLLPSASELDIAGTGSHARVAGGPKGWIIVYQGVGSGDADGIFMKSVDLNGAVGPEVAVNSKVEGLQEQPDVAMLEDGRAIAVWRSDSDVFFQRYGADGVALPGDQDGPLNTTGGGDQWNPAVVASVGLGEFFAVAWEHNATGEIFARFPGAGGGFLFNSVTGQNSDFPASHQGIPGFRRLPAVAVGGGGYVAIGWQDDNPDHPGIYVRRFPLPSTQ